MFIFTSLVQDPPTSAAACKQGAVVDIYLFLEERLSGFFLGNKYLEIHP